MNVKYEFHFLDFPIAQYGARIPFIVTDLIEQLRKINAARVEGIFRLSGSSLVVDNCLNELDKGRITDWKPYQNGITLACVLKAYFRKLALIDPLLTFERYDLFVCFADIPDDETMCKRIKEACLDLPLPHLQTLAYLMRYLHEVQLNSAENKMTAKNLAICFAPNILVPNGSSGENLFAKENPQQNKVVEIIIQNADDIFASVNITPSAFMTDDEIQILQSTANSDYMSDLILQRQTFRSKSVIPYAPPCCYGTPRFVRPV